MVWQRKLTHLQRSRPVSKWSLYVGKRLSQAVRGPLFSSILDSTWEVVVEPSFFLARFWGFLLVITPLCYLIRKENLPRLLQALSQESAHLIFVLAGYLGIILGSATIILHNSWYPNLGLLVTLLGWISLFSGIVHVTFADRLHVMARANLSRLPALRMILVIAMIVGVILLLPI